MGISSSLCIGSHKTQAQTAMSSSSPAGRDTSLVQAHTHNTLHVPKHTHIFVDLPSTSMAPLPTQLCCPAPGPLTHPTGPQSLVGPAWYSLVNLHTHTLVPLYSTFWSPSGCTSTDPCLSDTPSWTWSPLTHWRVHLQVCQWVQMHRLTHKPGLRKIQTFASQQPVPSTHDLQSCSSHWHQAP